MSEKILRIEEKKDISVGVFFTNVKASIKDVINAYAESTNPGTQVTGPWSKIKSEGIEAYGLVGNDNEIVEILEDIEGSTFRRKSLTTEYEFTDEKQSKSIIKGFKYYTRYNSGLVSDGNQINIKERFIKEAKIVSGSSAYAGVFFNKEKIDDYSVDISIDRSIDTLDTLSVKNNPLSEYPRQDSNTGTVMGTLYAKQKILDENGEKVKIPLSNVPVAIFNPSKDFPTLASLDDDGNRISLNIAQNSKKEDYADIESFITDFGKKLTEQALGKSISNKFNGSPQLLQSHNYINVPEKYKYATITNKNGEFIIQNVPIGNQTLTFEVDLLKQGMTKGEIALNYFPYPVDIEPNIDSIPHFYFRQIPVGVSPSWGSFQTGYTQIDIVANIDMRKWTTFFVAPISIDGKSMTQLLAAGLIAPLTVMVKDMTREGYPLVGEVVEILDIYDRDDTQRIEWRNEFKSRKNKAQFRAGNFQAFKLPANLYDPNGKASINAERKGVKSKEGVWLSSYQMKMFYGNDVGSTNFRATGFVRNEITNNSNILKHSNHFDINRGIGFGRDAAIGGEPESKLTFFPYEKPWSINYPNKYTIPTRPIKKNETKKFNGGEPNDFREPRYLDGDLPGEWQDGKLSPNGWGLMQAVSTGDLIHNQFATTITFKRLYKYETNVAWHEEWSNGFRKYYHNNKNVNDRPSFTIMGEVDGYNYRNSRVGNKFTRIDGGDFVKDGFKSGDNIAYASKVASSSSIKATVKTGLSASSLAEKKLRQYSRLSGGKGFGTSTYSRRGRNRRKGGGKAPGAEVNSLIIFQIRSVTKTEMIIIGHRLQGRDSTSFFDSGPIPPYILEATFTIGGVGGEDFYPSKTFEIPKGEGYQRVEAGFSYWLKPEGWARVKQTAWGDFTLSQDINSAYGDISQLLPTNYRDVMHRAGEVISLKMASGPALWQRTGGLELYRVMDDGTDFLYPTGPPEKKRYVNVTVSACVAMNKKRNNEKLKLKYESKSKASHSDNDMKIKITNNGSIARSVKVGGTSKTLAIGKSGVYSIKAGNTISLPGNHSFDIIENSYKTSRYSFTVSTTSISGAGEVKKDLGIKSWSAGIATSIPRYYAVSTCYNTLSPVKKKKNGYKCRNNDYVTGTIAVQGFVLEASGKSSVSIGFRTNAVVPDCSNGGIGCDNLSAS